MNKSNKVYIKKFYNELAKIETIDDFQFSNSDNTIFFLKIGDESRLYITPLFKYAQNKSTDQTIDVEFYDNELVFDQSIPFQITKNLSTDVENFITIIKQALPVLVYKIKRYGLDMPYRDFDININQEMLKKL